MDNTPEQVAYRLMLDIAKVEGKKDNFGSLSGYDRQWLLDTYAECLKAVHGKRYTGPGAGSVSLVG